MAIKVNAKIRRYLIKMDAIIGDGKVKKINTWNAYIEK